MRPRSTSTPATRSPPPATPLASRRCSRPRRAPAARSERRTVSGLVDRDLAETIALRIAGGAGGGAADPRLGEHAAAAAEAVLAYTCLSIDEPLPEAEWIDRAGWILTNLENFTAAAELIEARVG